MSAPLTSFNANFALQQIGVVEHYTPGGRAEVQEAIDGLRAIRECQHTVIDTAELEALRRDAGRYRYRQHPEFNYHGPYDSDGDFRGYDVAVIGTRPICYTNIFKALEEAIDAAMQSSKEAGK